MHCGAFDNSDEENCPGRIIAVSMYSVAAGVGLGFIALLTVFVIWRSHRHRQQNVRTSLRSDCVAFLQACTQFRAIRSRCARLRTGSEQDDTNNQNVAANSGARERHSDEKLSDMNQNSEDDPQTTRNYHADSSKSTVGKAEHSGTSKQTCVILQNPAYCDAHTRPMSIGPVTSI
jgi:hypothetical protein